MFSNTQLLDNILQIESARISRSLENVVAVKKTDPDLLNLIVG